MAGLVYYSSASGNTERFMHKLGLPAMRIPVDESAPMPEPDGPFVLISPTYADGEGHGAVARWSTSPDDSDHYLLQIIADGLWVHDHINGFSLSPQQRQQFTQQALMLFHPDPG